MYMNMSKESAVDTWCGDLKQSAQLNQPSLLLEAWLSSTGSLTYQLQQHFSELVYQLLYAGMAPVDEQERQFLNFDSQSCWTRYVWFGEKTEHYVFSKVVVAPALTVELGNTIEQWGAKPLGQLLFQEGGRVREKIQYQFLSSKHPYLLALQHYLPCVIPGCWARRSICYYQQQPMMVVDLFLPDLVKRLSHG